MLLWALLEPQKLSPDLHNALEDSNNTLVVSAAPVGRADLVLASTDPAFTQFEGVVTLG